MLGEEILYCYKYPKHTKLNNVLFQDKNMCLTRRVKSKEMIHAKFRIEKLQNLEKEERYDRGEAFTQIHIE